MNLAFLRSHWKLLAGSFAGILILYYIVKHGSASSSAPDLSSGSGAVNMSDATALTAGASAQIAQIQAQAVTASTALNVQASLADTAAKLAAVQSTNNTTLAASLDKDSSAVSIQKLQSEQAIKQTQLQGETLSNLAVTSAQTTLGVVNAQAGVALAGIQLKQNIYNTLAGQKKLGGDSEGVTKILSGLFGQGPAAIAASQPSAVANSAGAVTSGIGHVLQGLFA